MRASFLLIIVLHAAPAHSLTLGEALRHVYEHDPELQAVRSNVRSFDERLAIAKSGYRPKLSASTSGELRHVDEGSSSYDLNTFRSSVSLDQNIYRGGATRAEVRRARSEIASSHQQLRIAEQDVFFAAIEAYLSVRRDEAILVAASSNQDRLERQLQAAEDRFRFGEVTRTDVAQAEARLAAAVADRFRAEADLELARARFRETIGLEPNDISDPGEQIRLPSDLETALATSDDVPEVLAAEYSLDASRHNVDARFAELYPRLDLRGEANHVEDPSRSIDQQSDLAASAILTIPLFQGGAEYAQVREAKQIAIENRYRVDDEVRAAEQRITAQWLELQAAEARLSSIRSQVRAAEIALDGVREEALVGARTVLDILDQEQELFESEIDLARTLFDQRLAAYGLAAAMGRLSATELNLSVEIYDPLINLGYTESRWIGVNVREEE
jgi:TolC family type I secretion outer membrane protein